MKLFRREMKIRNPLRLNLDRAEIRNRITNRQSPFARHSRPPLASATGGIRSLVPGSDWQATRPPLPPLAKGGRSAARRGFTLVELMVVIVIIAVLAGLVLPAIYRAVVNAREARVIVEINGLSAGIAAFKSKYGSEPPSRITIYLTGDPVAKTGWYSDPAAMGTIRSLWPQFDFTMGGGAGATFPSFWSGIAKNNAINLNSGECLLFFLGGVIDTANSPTTKQCLTPPTGFAKNPKWPFAPTSVVANREGPFFEFTDISRVRDIDTNGINEWYDTLPGQANPYLYFSSYDGQGYRIAELPQNTAGTSYLFIHDFYRVSSTSVNPPAAPAVTPTGSQTLPAQKPQSFQIISPGYDTNYGSGGIFNATLANAGLVDSTGAADTDAFDNLTNFNPGRLKP